MTRDDALTFGEWLAELTEYYPHSKVHLDAVLPGYFGALGEVDVGCLRLLLLAVLRQCRYFPTAAELLQLAASLPTPPGCPRCPTGHGAHRGHVVRHFQGGPYCETCHRAMPVPPGYVPYAPPPPVRPQLAEQGDT